MQVTTGGAGTEPVSVNVDGVDLAGELGVPDSAEAIVIFAHGSGSGRTSPRNREVARILREARLGTLLVDLLTEEEAVAERITRHLRFQIPLLAERLIATVDWLERQPVARGRKLGLHSASTGTAAAIVAATERPEVIGAVVSRGGRPDLAGEALDRLRQPTLLIVGGDDPQVMELNRLAFDRMLGEKELKSVPGASHLFEEPGALESVARMAREWFRVHLTHALEVRPSGIGPS